MRASYVSRMPSLDGSFNAGGSDLHAGEMGTETLENKSKSIEFPI
jgi:hypothetical protein